MYLAAFYFFRFMRERGGGRERGRQFFDIFNVICKSEDKIADTAFNSIQSINQNDIISERKREREGEGEISL